MEQAAAAKPLLEVRGLNIAFARGKKQTLRAENVHFQVRPGEIVSIVGESGCGKSITALSLLGLLGRQGHVTGGEALFEGKNLLSMTEKELDQVRGSRIAMIFQDIMYSLNPVFTVGNQLMEPLRRHRHMGRQAAWSHAVELLKKTGIPHADEVMRKYPHMLSGGMRQRVMIAMALTCEPQLLIADEPTTALDVTIQLQIMQLLKQLRDEYGMAILLITHDIGLVTEMADRVVVMYAGQCVEEGTTEQVLTTPGHPYTQALMRAVPGLHDAKDRRLYAIPGTVPEDYPAMTGCRFAPRCPYGAACAKGNDVAMLAPGHTVRCCRAEKEQVTKYA